MSDLLACYQDLRRLWVAVLYQEARPRDRISAMELHGVEKTMRSATSVIPDQVLVED